MSLKDLGLDTKQKGNRAWRRDDKKWKNGAVARSRKDNIFRNKEMQKAMRLGTIEKKHEANRVRLEKRRAVKKQKGD